MEWGWAGVGSGDGLRRFADHWAGLGSGDGLRRVADHWAELGWAAATG